MDNILNILNHPGILITFNGSPIKVVTFLADTETYLFWYHHGETVEVNSESLMFASWDEDENDEQPFYIVIDRSNIHHIVKFFRNDSLDIMMELKNSTP